MLNGRRAQVGGELLKNRLAGGAVVNLRTHLNQAMGVERGINFFLNSGGQPARANHDDSVQVVRLGPVVFALGRGQYYLGHAEIIGEPRQGGQLPDEIKFPAKHGKSQKNRRRQCQARQPRFVDLAAALGAVGVGFFDFFRTLPGI